ncbi:type I restriction endonuclease subunit R [Ureaplasma ceti]|uniref:Type I restriction enzyme endonuclease subunit n=1 Tax=Ureaplasma ceti TaxID=3119530 RepID=A0ABP9UB56_9BACT
MSELIQNSVTFSNEREFEDALISVLRKNGWEEVIDYPTEEDLIANWAKILFNNNQGIDQLNGVPLTRTEMQQIIEQINSLNCPKDLNNFINGSTVSIKRDNEDDKLHFGKEVSLKIYNRKEIAAGKSRYQIVRQPRFINTNPIKQDRRGDLMLLINGMPVFHLELKKTGIPVNEATNQIEKYLKESLFRGLYSLVQIFVSMTPNETYYFTNPGNNKNIDRRFCFHWEDDNNVVMSDWSKIASSLLSIPMAHKMIGFYTIPDDSDGKLKVLRSYQYYAAHKIADKVAKHNWDEKDPRGGYIWHTTGSGKTMTSFKAAELISRSNDADKVVFLTDRIELGTQSLYEYRNFADDKDSVQSTEDTYTLINKLVSKDPKNSLIVTSIQKMSNITEDNAILQENEIIKINSKRLVFIVDEAHRSTFGQMLWNIKHTFPKALFFGFTGTPIYDENAKQDLTTANIFGDELDRYTIADGIKDKNVLGFDTYKVETFAKQDLRDALAKQKLHIGNISEIYADDKKLDIYEKQYKNMDILEVEKELPSVQYNIDEHRIAVVDNINKNWQNISENSVFHAILATSSIPEAIKYYRLFKERTELKVTALFDKNIDNKGNDGEQGAIFKEDGLVEIIEDYNAQFQQQFTISTHDKFKKDVAARLAHKKPYEQTNFTVNKQLNLLIVVDQMLTGFDSKWVNALYLDKVLEYEGLIQAFSRTNRIFSGAKNKPFGVIKYYRRPNTMEENVKEAISFYSGDRPIDLLVDKLPINIDKINDTFKEIETLFRSSGVDNFEKLPEDEPDKGKFASLFKKLKEYIDSAKIQGFEWDSDNTIELEDGTIELKSCNLNEDTYFALIQRYQEIACDISNNEKSDEEKEQLLPYDIDIHLVEYELGQIDNKYMESRFQKYLKDLRSEKDFSETKELLHKTFSTLSQEDQKIAEIFIHDIETGEAKIVENWTFIDYINDYKVKKQNTYLNQLFDAFGCDIKQVDHLIKLGVNESNINEFQWFDKIKETIDIEKACIYFEKSKYEKISNWKAKIEAVKTIKEFILRRGFKLY